MKFQLLIKTKIPTNKKVSFLKSLICCISHAYKCLNANKCWHFNIYEQDKFCAQLSRVLKSFIPSGPDVVSDLDLHCLPISYKKDARLNWVKSSMPRNSVI